MEGQLISSCCGSRVVIGNFNGLAPGCHTQNGGQICDPDEWVPVRIIGNVKVTADHCPLCGGKVVFRRSGPSIHPECPNLHCALQGRMPFIPVCPDMKIIVAYKISSMPLIQPFE